MVEYSDTVIRLLSAFLILILGLILGHIISNIIKKIIKGIEINQLLKKQLKIEVKIEKSVSFITKYLIYFITIILALNTLGIKTKTLQIILIIVIAIILIFIVLAFKDWLPNFIAGLYLLKTKKIKKGDIIKNQDIKGKVIQVNLLETKIETNNNELIFIPNQNITKYELIKRKK